MITTIHITGQISGNHTLRSALTTLDTMESKRFNDIILTYPTKAAAKKALWAAFKHLNTDRQDAIASRLTYSKAGILRYDASVATIQ